MKMDFSTKIALQIGGFILLMAIIGSIKLNNILTTQNADDIIKLDRKIIDTKKRVYYLEIENDKLKKLIIETSNIPNEKRKAIFNLKIQQDSVLIDMLMNDMRANEKVLELLETNWVFNNDTEFKSLNDK